MKKILLLYILVLLAFSAQAQFPQYFDTVCSGISQATYPSQWAEYTPPSVSTNDSLKWGCAGIGGVNGTGAMRCEGFDSGHYRIDTSYLITPMVNYTGSDFPDSMYLTFDTHTDMPATNLDIYITQDSDFTTLGQVGVLKTSELAPPFTNDDMTGWVTHRLNLTQYVGIPFYVAFRYISDTLEGSTWFVDNVQFTGSALGVTNVTPQTLPLIVIGNSTPNLIKLSYGVQEPGYYNLAVYDMVGRQVYNSSVVAQSGMVIYSIAGLHFASGMYVVKMGNERGYSVVKTMVE